MNKANLKIRGTALITEYHGGKLFCIRCGKVYQPVNFVPFNIPPIMLLNWCSRKCYDEDAQTHQPTNALPVRLAKKIKNRLFAALTQMRGINKFFNRALRQG